MKKLLVLAAAVGGLLIGTAGTASAAGQVCHSVKITVNGQDVVNDAACNALP